MLLCELMEALPEDEMRGSVWPHVAPLVSPSLAEWPAHSLLIAMRLARTVPASTFTSLLPHVTLYKGSLLNNTNLPALVPVLKGSSIAHPRLHAVWDGPYMPAHLPFR